MLEALKYMFYVFSDRNFIYLFDIYFRFSDIELNMI